MSFFNDTNRKRVQKICDLLDLLETSRTKNNESAESVWMLLQTAISQMESMLAGADAPEPSEPQSEPQSRSKNSHTRQDIQIREAAQTASLKDLTMAMAVYLNRIDEELNK